MFKHQSIWLPDGEQHFPKWMDSAGEIVDGRGTYQIRKWRACLPWIRNWRTAVDVGAHVGFWALQMMPRFHIVHAFEPMAEFRECFVKNVFAGLDYVDGTGTFREDVLHKCALGASAGRVRMDYNPADSGNTHVAGDGDIEMRTLDSFELQNVDFVKIDVEGFEIGVVQGAAETLARCRPCMIIEQKPHKLAANFGATGTPAVDFVKSLGAQVRKVISGDYICSWD